MIHELRRILDQEGYALHVKTSVKAAKAALASQVFDLILLDIGLPDGDGLEVLSHANAMLVSTPTVILTSLGTTERTAEAMKLGAEDFLEKPVPKARLLVAIRNALRRCTQSRELGDLRERVEDLRTGMVLDRLPGISRAMRGVRDFVLRTADESATILITGPRGSGKTLVAGVYARLRAGRPFKSVNTPSIAPNLFEAELFGTRYGSFTGATNRAGLIESAEDGTLFLDEIGDLSAGAQSKLLQVLRERTYRRVGETEDRECRARVIAATNRDLNAEVAAGRFRADLLDRLGELRLTMPALSERPDDIVYLVLRFIEESCQEAKVPLKRLSPEAETALSAYDWPGNVEELRQVAQRVRIFATSSRITRRDIQQAIGHGRHDEGVAATRTGTLREQLATHERDIIRRALREHDGAIAKTAAALGIDRVTLWRKMREQGLESARS